MIKRNVYHETLICVLSTVVSLTTMYIDREIQRICTTKWASVITSNGREMVFCTSLVSHSYGMPYAYVLKKCEGEPKWWESTKMARKRTKIEK